MGLISGSGRSPGRGNGNPLQYSCWENSMDRGAWWTAVHGVTKSWTRLSMHSCIFTNWRFETTLHSTNLEAPFFQLHWLNSCFHVTFWNSHNISDFFFFFFFFLFLLIINIKMNPPQVYMCSPSWTLLPPPSPYHPSGSSQCTIFLVTIVIVLGHHEPWHRTTWHRT